MNGGEAITSRHIILIIIMSKFFYPFIGKDYNQGINGKRVLILGASFYCPKVDCKYYKDCTDTKTKDSSKYDMICPEYDKKGLCLHEEPTNSINSEYSTYVTFAKGLAHFIGSNDYVNIWNHLAFTNYVQFFLPGSGENFRPTNASDLSERDFNAFIEVLKLLSPNIVVIWGCVINSRLKEFNEYVFDKEILKDTDWYVCHMRLPGVNHDIALVNSNHPSSSAWHSDKPNFDTYFHKVLFE